MITENNLIDDNRPYRYEQNSQEQQSLFTNNENYNANDNKNEDYTLENQNENNNETMVHHINENTSEYITPEPTTSAQDASQAGTSTNNHLVRVPTRVVSPRPNTYDSQSYSDTSPRRNLTFNFPSNSDDEIQEETQNLTSFRNFSFDVSSPTRTILDNTQNKNTAKIQLDLCTVLHHFLLYLNIQTKQFDLKTIIINKLPVDIMTYLIILFTHNLIQIFKQRIIKTLFNLTIILSSQHITRSHSHYQQIPHKQTLFHKTKEYHIRTLYNRLKDDFKILHFHIYLPTPYIK